VRSRSGQGPVDLILLRAAAIGRRHGVRVIAAKDVDFVRLRQSGFR
jgi:hypothetical protein